MASQTTADQAWAAKIIAGHLPESDPQAVREQPPPSPGLTSAAAHTATHPRNSRSLSPQSRFMAIIGIMLAVTLTWYFLAGRAMLMTFLAGYSQAAIARMTQVLIASTIPLAVGSVVIHVILFNRKQKHMNNARLQGEQRYRRKLDAKALSGEALPPQDTCASQAKPPE